MSVELALVPDYGLQVNYEFKTDINETMTGTDYINSRWKYPLAKYNFSLAWFSKSRYEYLRNFFYYTKGQTETFLFLDPTDYKVTYNINDTGYGVTTQGVVIFQDNKYQLAKKYTLDGNYIIRPITRPKTFVLYDGNGLEIDIGDYAIDQETGVFLNGGNVNWTWEGEFYTPVRFETETLPQEFLSFDEIDEESTFSCPDLRLIEVKESNIQISNLDDFLLNTNHIFKLKLDFNSGYAVEFKGDIFTADSGFEIRTTTQFDYKHDISGSVGIIGEKEKDYLVGLWRILLGTAGKFRFVETEIFNCRFKESFTIKTLLTDEEGNDLFSVDNISLKRELKAIRSSYCQVWIIEREDGIVQGFTNHDQKLLVNGVVCECNVGLLGTGTQRTAELNTDSTELSGVFIQVTEAELLGGKFDNAEIKIYLYDWRDNQIVSTQFRGNIGSYSIGYVPNSLDNFTTAFGKQYQLEALSIAQKLDVNISTQTSSECRHKFLSQGYGRCNKTIDSLVRGTSEVTAINGNNVIQIGFGTDNWVGYKYGILKFTSGILEGTEIYILNANGLDVTLLYPPPVLPSVGDTVELTRHCPKTLDACRDYNNLSNYGGFPKLPGVDLTISGADDV